MSFRILPYPIRTTSKRSRLSSCSAVLRGQSLDSSKTKVTEGQQSLLRSDTDVVDEWAKLLGSLSAKCDRGEWESRVERYAHEFKNTANRCGDRAG